MKVRFYLLLLFLSLPGFAQEASSDVRGRSAQEDWEKKEKYLPLSQAEIKELDFETIDYLKRYEFLDKRMIPPPNLTEKFQRKEWTPEPFRAMVKKDSIIYSLKDGSGHILYRDAYVWAQEKYIGAKLIYLYDKKGEVRYKTSRYNIVSIEDDMDIKPEPARYTTYPPPSRYHTMDEYLSLGHRFIYHAETLQDNYVTDVFEALTPNIILGERTYTATAYRLEWRSFYHWESELEFGLSFSFQEGGFKEQATGLIFRTVFLGPIVQYPFWRRETRYWNAHFSFQKSLFYQISSSDQTFKFKYSANALQLGLDHSWFTKYGEFMLGGTFRRMTISLKEAALPVPRKSERNSIYSFALSLTYGFDTNIW